MVPIGSVPIPRNRTVCMYVCMYYKYVHVCVCVLNSWLLGTLRRIPALLRRRRRVVGWAGVLLDAIGVGWKAPNALWMDVRGP